MDGKDWVHLCHVPGVAEQLFVFPCDLLLHVASMVSQMKHANRQTYLPIIHLFYAICTKKNA
jgi:hypothetical protein